MVRLLQAEFTAPSFVEEPPVASVLGLIGEFELDYRSCIAEMLGMRALFQRPKQEANIDLMLGEFPPGPSLAPCAERHHDRYQFRPRSGHMIRPATPVGRPTPDDDALRLQIPSTL